MATAAPTSRGQTKLSKVLTSDFCPSLNRYVYWLKEPIGWFVLATIMSVMVGMHVAPIGWTLAVSLSALIVVGLVWPYVAVRAASFVVTAPGDSVHEDDLCRLRVMVKNRWPIPLWGLAVEGYLDSGLRHEESALSKPTVALAYVRALSTSVYSLDVRPSLRGHYPNRQTIISCSFPFCIWTAKRPITNVQPIIVWPRVYPIAASLDWLGTMRSDSGDGSSNCGRLDFVGLREYRPGDQYKDVNWVATARGDRLMVNQRGGPQSSLWQLIIDDGAGDQKTVCDRIRVAASTVNWLHEQKMTVDVQIGKTTFHVGQCRQDWVEVMNRLAAVPVQGVPTKASEVSSTTDQSGDRHPSKAAGHLDDGNSFDATVIVSSTANGDVRVRTARRSNEHRHDAERQQQIVDRRQPIEEQIKRLWHRELQSHVA